MSTSINRAVPGNSKCTSAAGCMSVSQSTTTPPMIVLSNNYGELLSRRYQDARSLVASSSLDAIKCFMRDSAHAERVRIEMVTCAHLIKVP
mmetsp:Transcript_28470/g.69334  ORF Transcript_28470/g.69334 Transcript_28470/m.69334 type:complete len:91 (+) Transcript_28470:183-455(+)